MTSSHAYPGMLEELRAVFGARALERVPLARYCTYQVGGEADAWVTVRQFDELVVLARLARERSWPLLVVGACSNVLFADAGVRGIVARMALREWRLEPLDGERVRLVAGAGSKLPALALALAKEGVTGLEWAVGVPGTVGGAVVSNAGTGDGHDVRETLESVSIFAAGGDLSVERRAAESLELGYRSSVLRAGRHVTFDGSGRLVPAKRTLIEPAEIVVEATFLLRRDDPAAVAQRNQDYLTYRERTQPKGKDGKNAGSVFKNPDPAHGRYSGKLIQDAGLRGATHGGAQIYERHGNFIVNTGGATAADVAALIARAHDTVRERFGIELEMEVEPRGEW
jgi:UDP-N-acetylmuramate dehydrogenase